MEKAHTVRFPVVNGLFYPDSKAELEQSIEGYLDRVNVESLFELITEQTGMQDIVPIAVVSPHAGYIFSGSVQAYSYSILRSFSFDTVIVIGPSHQTPFDGISVNLDVAYETPLGKLEVNLDFAEKLIAQNECITHHEDAHLNEHSIEVQLPFLQICVPGARIVPVLLGTQSIDNSCILSDALIAIIKKMPGSYITVVSTDLSHYHSHVDAAAMDGVIIEDLRSMDPERLSRHIAEGKSEACGFGGILTGILLSQARGAGKCAILQYRDSGEVSGDRRNVVGYLSAALY